MAFPLSITEVQAFIRINKKKLLRWKVMVAYTIIKGHANVTLHILFMCVCFGFKVELGGYLAQLPAGCRKP